MNQNATPLAVYDGETLMDARLPKCSFCIETLLPEGISMLGGAPKIGKSWIVLDIGLHLARGVFITDEDALSLRLPNKLADLREAYANPGPTSLRLWERLLAALH